MLTSATILAVVKIVVPIVLTGISTFVIPWIRNKAKQEEYSKYQHFAEIAASKVEELSAIADDKWPAADKKEAAMKLLTEQFPKANKDLLDTILVATLPIIGMGKAAKL